MTDGFAREGYLAIAPSLFDRVRRNVELGYDAEDVQQGRGYVLQIPKRNCCSTCGRAINVVRHAGRGGRRSATAGAASLAHLAACELPVARRGGLLRHAHRARTCTRQAARAGAVSLRRARQDHSARSHREDPRRGSRRRVFQSTRPTTASTATIARAFDAAAATARARTHAGLPRARTWPGRPMPQDDPADATLEASLITHVQLRSLAGVPLTHGPSKDRRAAGQFRHARFARHQGRAHASCAACCATAAPSRCSRAIWCWILYFVILPLRPARVLPKYRRVWTDTGLAAAAAFHGAARCTARARCATRARQPMCRWSSGMLYSTPDVAQGLTRPARGRRTAHGRAAAVPAVLRHHQCAPRWTRWARRCAPGATCRSCTCCPTMRRKPGYIGALADSVRAHWRAHGAGDHLLMTFHGIPKPAMSRRATPTVASASSRRARSRVALGLRRRRLVASASSRAWARAEWLRPYTDDGDRELAQRGVKHARCHLPGLRGGLPRDHRRDRP